MSGKQLKKSARSERLGRNPFEQKTSGGTKRKPAPAASEASTRIAAAERAGADQQRRQNLLAGPWFFVDMWTNLIADSCSFWIASLAGLREIARAGSRESEGSQFAQPYPASSSSSPSSSVAAGA